MYGEVLCRIDAATVTGIRSVRWFLEIAGLEGIDWRVFWPLDVILLLSGWLFFRRINARAHRTRVIVIAVAMSGVTIGFLAFGLTNEFPWSAFWFIAATLLGVPLLIGTIKSISAST
jgi:hypothetical protein